MRAAITGRTVRLLSAVPVIAGLLIAANQPLVDAAENKLTQYKVSRPDYKQRYGYWQKLAMPPELKINAIHAALLNTGKVLIIAGSGNKEGSFNAGNFRSLLYDPKTDGFKAIDTPIDMFCAGHTYLPDGKLLIAGGTSKFEVLKDKVTRAAGVMELNNASTTRAISLKKGTVFRSKDGAAYTSRKNVVIPRAKMGWTAKDERGIVEGFAEVWVTAVKPGESSVKERPTTFRATGLSAARARDLGADTGRLSMDTQDFAGDKRSYLFDPVTERYQRVGDMNKARWYPSLTNIGKGQVLATSGLDEFGRMIQGQNEVYDADTRKWTAREDLKRILPTYPALFPIADGRLFYSASNAGYGSAEVGRDAGIWDLKDNSFQKVPGLRDPELTETSGSVLLPPAQDQKVMIAGGGGVGESPKSTARMDVADLKLIKPKYEPAGELPKPVRYPNLVITPDDQVVITGGSTGYRGKGASDVLLCSLYDPDRKRLSRGADPSVGRNYHAEALLLPDGRIITLGSDPLFGDRENTQNGKFEQRIEVYTPPYLYQGKRPEISGGPTEVERGERYNFATEDSSAIETMRLMRPSAVTHVTDSDQRSVAIKFTRRDGAVKATLPKGEGLVPSGWYMLFATSRRGTPSEAHWVHVK